MDRPRTWNAEERTKDRKDKKKTWYKKGDKKSFIMVPYTKDSELRKEYTKCIADSGFQIKVVEKAGVSLKRKLQRSDPYREKNCGCADCFICSSGGKGSCKMEGVDYQINCDQCNYPV